MGAALRVGAAAGVVSKPVEHDDVEGVVGLSPLRLSRWRWIRPLLAGTGATPQRSANSASVVKISAMPTWESRSCRRRGARPALPFPVWALQHPDRLDVTVPQLRHPRRRPRQDRSSGGIGVERVELTVRAAGLAVWAVDLYHGGARSYAGSESTARGRRSIAKCPITNADQFAVPR